MSGILVLVCVLALAGGAVGLNIMRCAWVMRQPAAWFIGIAMFAHSMVTQPISIFFLQMGHSPRILLLLMSISMATSLVCVYAFVWRVFRPGSRWAAAFAWLGMAVAVAAGVSSFAVGGAFDSPERKALMLVNELDFIVVNVWAGAEALLYRQRLLKRARISYSNPLVENQLLVWACTMLAATVVTVGAAILAMMGETALSSQVTLAIGFVGTVGWYLGFTPPAIYCNWIEGRASGRAASESAT